MSKKKLIKRCKLGDVVERSDNTRVKMPKTDVEPIYYEPAALVERAIRKLPQAGSLTPVYPEFDLLTLGRSLKHFFTKGPKFVKDISEGIKGLNTKQHMYHLDYGDLIGAFSNNGAFVSKGKLHPGKSTHGLKSYIWFNLSKPYTTRVNNRDLTRAIILDESNIDNLILVRSSKIPIGLWNGKSGFVLKSEYVTPKSVDLQNAIIYNKIPIGWIKQNSSFPIFGFSPLLSGE